MSNNPKLNESIRAKLLERCEEYGCMYEADVSDDGTDQYCWPEWNTQIVDECGKSLVILREWIHSCAFTPVELRYIHENLPREAWDKLGLELPDRLGFNVTGMVWDAAKQKLARSMLPGLDAGEHCCDQINCSQCLLREVANTNAGCWSDGRGPERAEILRKVLDAQQPKKLEYTIPQISDPEVLEWLRSCVSKGRCQSGRSCDDICGVWVTPNRDVLTLNEECWTDNKPDPQYLEMFQTILDAQLPPLEYEVPVLNAEEREHVERLLPLTKSQCSKGQCGGLEQCPLCNRITDKIFSDVFLKGKCPSIGTGQKYKRKQIVDTLQVVLDKQESLLPPHNVVKFEQEVFDNWMWWLALSATKQRNKCPYNRGDWKDRTKEDCLKYCDPVFLERNGSCPCGRYSPEITRVVIEKCVALGVFEEYDVWDDEGIKYTIIGNLDGNRCHPFKGGTMSEQALLNCSKTPPKFVKYPIWLTDHHEMLLSLRGKTFQVYKHEGSWLYFGDCRKIRIANTHLYTKTPPKEELEYKKGVILSQAMKDNAKSLISRLTKLSYLDCRGFTCSDCPIKAIQLLDVHLCGDPSSVPFARRAEILQEVLDAQPKEEEFKPYLAALRYNGKIVSITREESSPDETTTRYYFNGGFRWVDEIIPITNPKELHDMLHEMSGEKGVVEEIKANLLKWSLDVDPNNSNSYYRGQAYEMALTMISELERKAKCGSKKS